MVSDGFQEHLEAFWRCFKRCLEISWRLKGIQSLRFEGHFIGFQEKTPIREFREFQKVSGWFQVVSRDRRTVFMSLGAFQMVGHCRRFLGVYWGC